MDTTPPPAAPPVSSAPPVASVPEDKTVAILSYLLMIGFVIAIVIQGSKKTQLGAYHLRQMLGNLLLLVVAGVACEVVLLFMPIHGWLCICVILVSVFVEWLMGLLAAIKGEMKPAPFLGRCIRNGSVALLIDRRTATPMPAGDFL